MSDGEKGLGISRFERGSGMLIPGVRLSVVFSRVRRAGRAGRGGRGGEEGGGQVESKAFFID